MPENPAALTARLEQLVKQIMQEPDPMKYDQLGSEIWAILDELESLRTHTVHAKSPLYGQ
jgi:hypothetical protein